MNQVFKALLVLTLFSCAAAQTLWGQATYGMTPEQVLEAYPNATRVQDGDSLTTGEKELVRLDGVEVLGDSFRAAFFFLDNKLEAVSLTMDNSERFGLMKIDFEGLLTALRAKYGPEISLEEQSDFLSATWVSGEISIDLLLFDVGDAPAYLNIMYSTRLSKEGDNL